MARGLHWALILVPLLAAQQLDTANFSSDRKRGSLADRVESPAERTAFLELEKARSAGEKRRLADDFARQYPQSWLLASAYQVSAAASLDLGDYGRVLADGRRSLALQPENAPLLIAMARIEAAQGNSAAAKHDAEDALLWLSVIGTPGGVSAKEWARTSRDLEQSARQLIYATGGGLVPPWATAPEAPAKSGTLPYAGSGACRECHRQVYESWRQTGMSRMLRPLGGGDGTLADFSKPGEFEDSGGRAVARFGGGARPYFEFAVPGGWKRFRVDYTVGSKWQQAYATRLTDGRIYVFPIQFSAVQKRWLNYWATIDPPGSERSQIEEFPKLAPATSYQRNCAVCHTSQLRLQRLDQSDMQSATFREPGVDCEMCHGPSGAHVSSMRGQAERKTADAGPPFRFARLDHWRGSMICGQCHRQSAARELGSRGEMNYSPAQPYFSWLLSQPAAEFGTRAFYKDGRFRETTFIGEAFMRSACFRRGTAQCASCHDPHPEDPRKNRNSLRFPDDPDQMCLQCHTALLPRIAQHTRHAARSEGSRCIACHMPPIMNSLMFRAASHEIEIPRADPTVRFGQEASPSACLICHKDRDTGWLAETLKRW